MRIIIYAAALMVAGFAAAGCATKTRDGGASAIPWRMNIAPNQALEVDTNTVLSVDKKGLFGWKNRYGILVGPLPNRGDRARVAFANSTPTVDVFEGFGYFLGQHPRARTRRVSATGHGTEMIVQAGETMDRVFLIDNSVIEVIGRAVDPGSGATDSQGPTKRLEEPMTFIEAAGQEGSEYYVLSDPKHIEPGSEQESFVKSVLNAATAAGLK